MDLSRLERAGECEWRIPPANGMRVPAMLFGTEALIAALDDKVPEQACNVARLPGIARASFAMPDAHWGYGFPIGGVAAFDADEGVISAGGVGYDVSCGMRMIRTGVPAAEIRAIRRSLADSLYERIPAGVGSTGAIRLGPAEMEAMLRGGARWAVEKGWGRPEDLARIELGGVCEGADPSAVSARARERQRDEMGTLGSGNHYLEVQEVAQVFAPDAAAAFGLVAGEAVVTLHCGSRGLGHQVGAEFLAEMAEQAASFDLALPDRELACAPIASPLGRRYLGAMRAAANCALANRQILTSLTRRVITHFFPDADTRLVYDVSHNTCREEWHPLGRRGPRRLFVHRKGATRAFGPGHPELPPDLASVGQPVLIGGSMGTGSWVLAGTQRSMELAWGSACHGAGRAMSRHAALRRWTGRKLVDELAGAGIVVRSPSSRGVAEEAPGAYKDVDEVVDATDRAGLARRVARLVPIVCIKG